MAFFRNDTVNLLNLHYAVRALAQGGGAFFAAFLLRSGVPAPAVLAALALILAGRFVIRPLILAPARRWGLKPLVVAGSLVGALQYPLLAEVHGVGWMLLAVCALSSVGDTLYWTAYHAYFASLGDAEHRGHQIGAREALAAVVGIVAPLAGAWGLATAGPVWTFDVIALVQAASVLPLLGAPNVPVAAEAPGALQVARRGILLFCADGWFSAGFYYAWQVALFGSLSQSLTAFGEAAALAGLVGAAVVLLFGRHIDKGHGRRATVIAYAVGAGVVALRAASLGSPWLAVAANAAGALVVALVVPALMTAIYNLAKASPCPLRFHVATEGAWDIGCASGTLVAAALTWAGAPMAVSIALALPAAGAAMWLLWRYYGAHPAEGGVEIEPRLLGEPL